MRMCLHRPILVTLLLIAASDAVPAQNSSRSSPALTTQASTPSDGTTTNTPAMGAEVVGGLLHHAAVIVVIALILLAATVFRGVIWRSINLLWPIQLPSDWQTTIDRGAGGQDHEIAKISQAGPLVWGTTTTKTPPAHTYKVRGRIHGSNVCLTYRETGAVDIGAAMLRIRADKTMEGLEIGIDGKADAIAAFKYTWAPLPKKP